MVKPGAVIPVMAKVEYPAFLMGELGQFGIDMSAPEVYRKAPSLLDLQTAFFCSDYLGQRISPAYRAEVAWLQNEDATVKRTSGEATCTYLDNPNRRWVVRPERIEARGEAVHFEGGQVFMIGKDCEPLPEKDCGWTVAYSPVTGAPIRFGTMGQSREVFGQDASFALMDRHRVVAACVLHTSGSPFETYLTMGPGQSSPHFGVRQYHGPGNFG